MDKPSRKKPTTNLGKNDSSIKFTYIWQASIPDSWDRILKRKNVIKVNINKRNRNTLEFLEETQKYINRICPPLRPEELEIVPSSCKSQEGAKKFLELFNKSKISTPKRLSPLLKRRLEKPSKKLKYINSQFRIKQTKSYASTPILKSFEEIPKAAGWGVGIKGLKSANI